MREGYGVVRLTWKKHQEGDVAEIVWIPVGIAVAVMRIGGFALAYDGVTQTAKVTLAPKVLILETVVYLAPLITWN